MSSGIGGGIGGGAAAGGSRGGGPRGGGGAHRKNSSKKFGKNLNKLTKAPAAPPVPVVPAAAGAGSFSGSASSRNGLLLLSTKSKTTSTGLLTTAGAPKSAHDKLLLSAGAGRGEDGDDKPVVAAWGAGEKKEAAAPSPEKVGGGTADRPPQQRPVAGGRFSLRDASEKTERMESNGPYSMQQERRRPYDGGRHDGGRFSAREPYDGGRFPARESHDSGRFSARESHDGGRYPARESVGGGRFPAREPHDGGRFPARESHDGGRFSRENLDGGRFSAREVSDKMEGMALDRGDPPRKNVSDTDDKPVAKPTSDALEPGEIPDPESKTAPQKDDQVEYMSKLARERAEKRRAEEEARMAAQKERAALRLRELEEKRMEEKKKRQSEAKKQQDEKTKLQQVKSQVQQEEDRKQQQILRQERKEIAKPHVLLEPLGKSKMDGSDSSTPKSASKTQTADRKGSGRTLFDPNRPFSSLVGGKAAKTVVDNAKKKDLARLSRGSTRQSPVHGSTPAPSSRQPVGRFEADGEKEDEAPHVHMVQLNNLDELDRGAGQGGPRMLFDPTSGSMVEAKGKKGKQKGPQKSPAKEAGGKAATRRPGDGGLAGDNSPDIKRGKQGKGANRKDDPAVHPKSKKTLDSKGRQQKTPRKRLPRTCGVLYKRDKSGNYINADGCDPDNGYGSHRVPGGRVKNSAAYTMLLKREEEQNAPLFEPAVPATDGFSFRNDPGFVQHQTDFEAQQQKILEDAWASLVENEGEDEEKPGEKAVEDEPAPKSADDEYAAALAISPSMIGLNFDTNEGMDSVMLPPSIQAAANSTDEPIDLAKFALEAASSGAAQPANPFSSLGVSGAGLWGAGTAGASTSLGGLGALSGWDATPFAGTDTTATDLNGTSSNASKLHLWGSSALDTSDDVGLGAFGSTSDTAND